MNTVDTYLDLIPIGNQDKSNFRASITAAIEDVVVDEALVATIPELYNLAVAAGSQLDVVGMWVGLSRNVSVPISGIYFSLDTVDLGLNQGYLKGPYDPTQGVISLDDVTYRLMLQIKITANHWDGTLAQAQSILAQVLTGSPGTYLMVIDNMDMSITVAIAGVIPGTIFISLLKNYMTLIPLAVKLRELVVTSVSGSPLFGLDCESPYISGLDVGAFGIVY